MFLPASSPRRSQIMGQISSELKSFSLFKLALKREISALLEKKEESERERGST